MRIRSKIAICFARIVYHCIRLFSLGDGAALPGSLARRIDPKLLQSLAGQACRKIIVVMGTNGKTTVNSMIYQALSKEGKRVISNRTGANMENGIVTAFALGVRRKPADYACMEVDENAAQTILPKLEPDVILLTNLFRDQLDRYGEVDTVWERIRNAVSQVPEAVLAVNCDDALLAALLPGCPNHVVAYGIEEAFMDPIARPRVQEGTFCRFCGEKLRYSLIHYGQLGIYCCPGCGWKRPEADYRASRIHIGEEISTLKLAGRVLRPRLSAPYQAYNILAAYTALEAAGAPTESFGETVDCFDYDNHRECRFIINGASVQLYLAKNPVGFQQKLSLLCRDKRQKDIMILINDSAQDGRDVSWLWDVEFGYLADAGAEVIVTAGTRRYDMGLRLKYENIRCQVAEDVEEAVWRLTEQGTKNLYILVNYSGLQPMNRLLERWQEEQEYLHAQEEQEYFRAQEEQEYFRAQEEEDDL